MPPRRRIQYEGAIYHLMSRLDRREAIFSLDEIFISDCTHAADTAATTAVPSGPQHHSRL